MSLVLGSSVALAWIYADETTDAVLRLSDEIRIHGAWVPGLWRWEIANVLQLNVRRGRHSAFANRQDIVTWEVPGLNFAIKVHRTVRRRSGIEEERTFELESLRQKE